MSAILGDLKVTENRLSPVEQGLHPLNQKEITTDKIAVETLGDENYSPKMIDKKVSVLETPKFSPISDEEINKMTIQQLLERVLQACYLIQHDTKRMNTEFIHTLQNSLDQIVKRLSSQQGNVLWSIPSFISISASGLAGFVPAAKGVLEAVGGATKVVGDIMQQTDRSKETPISAELSQAQGTIQTVREKGPALNNEEEKSLSNLEKTLNELYQLIMGMANR